MDGVGYDCAISPFYPLNAGLVFPRENNKRFIFELVKLEKIEMTTDFVWTMSVSGGFCGRVVNPKPREFTPGDTKD